MFRTVLFCTLTTWVGASTAQSFSVEDVLSYSFASGLVTANNSESVAWIENHEGARNIWVAEGPDWQGRAVTRYVGDDGQDLGSLSFTADSESIVFVRGGAPNRQGEVPDPLYTPEAEGRAVWIVDLAGGEPRMLIETGNYSLSPTDNQLATVQGRDIKLVALAGEHAERIKTLARVRGTATSLRWSPDGSQLAFVSSRGDHSFIGVVDENGGALRYLDPGFANDRFPAWSPDGNSVAFLRIPNERVVHLFAPRPEGLPFSVRVADVSSGQGRELWKAPSGTGSAFSGVAAATQLYWASGNRLVFPWEGNGWKHLYSLPAAGGEPLLLTPGAFEVQHAAISEDGTTMVYDSGQNDINRRHIWSVAVDGSAEPLLHTPGDGIEWAPIMTRNGTVAFHASTATEPAHVVVLDGQARKRVSPALSNGFPSDHLVQPQAVVFEATDGLEIHGQLFLPPQESASGRHPALLFMHGGSRRQMLLGFHHRGYYHNAYAMNQLLANAGYVVLSVNYRSGIGYGLSFREAENYGATGASEYQDIVGAAHYLQSRSDVDPRRIGLWGGSYGGFLTAHGLAQNSDLFAAGVDIHGVHDWNLTINGFRPDYEPEDYPEFSQLAFESSPMAHIDGWRSPVLLIHGDDDRNVPFSESVNLVEELEKRDVHYEQLVFPDEVHGFLLHRNWTAAFEATLDFFERKLKNRDQ